MSYILDVHPQIIAVDPLDDNRLFLCIENSLKTVDLTAREIIMERAFRQNINFLHTGKSHLLVGMPNCAHIVTRSKPEVSKIFEFTLKGLSGLDESFACVEKDAIQLHSLDPQTTNMAIFTDKNKLYFFGTALSPTRIAGYNIEAILIWNRKDPSSLLHKIPIETETLWLSFACEQLWMGSVGSITHFCNFENNLRETIPATCFSKTQKSIAYIQDSWLIIKTGTYTERLHAPKEVTAIAFSTNKWFATLSSNGVTIHEIQDDDFYLSNMNPCSIQ